LPFRGEVAFCHASNFEQIAVSMLIRRALMIGVDVRALLLDVRLASSSGQKRAAANCVGSAYCVPAVRDTSLG
jgi:hypothetical protein